MKKIYSLLLVLLMAVLSVGTAQAWTIVHNTEQDSWFVAQYEDGSYCLVIQASSAVKDYTAANRTPWYQYREYINHISFADNFSGTPNVGNYCFAEMPNLTYAGLYSGYTHYSYTIGAHAFENCPKLTYVSCEKCTSIGDYAFKGCTSLGKDLCFSVGENMSSIGAHAFEECTSLGCVQTSVTVGTFSIGDYAFCKCSKLQYFDAAHIGSLGEYAFANCALTTITLTNCKTVGARAFNKNKLSYVRFGGAITSIGEKAFYDGLEDNGTFVMTRSTPPTTASDAFQACNVSTITLDCPSGNAYNVAPWSSFKAKTVDPELYVAVSGTTLTMYYDGQRYSRNGGLLYNETCWDISFDDMKKITKLVIDPSVAAALPTSTKNWFYYYYENLATIEGIEYLNTSEVTDMRNMFNGCKKLKAIDVSHFNTSKCTVMSSLFSQCESLTELNVNSFDMSKVESATFMFGSCTSLERIYCEKDWTSLGNSVLYYAFSNCPSLKGGWGTPYDENYKHHQYARPDGGSNAPGYFWRGGDTGEQPDYHEDIDQVQTDKVQSTKLIRDGMLLIERNGKTFNAQGVEVK